MKKRDTYILDIVHCLYLLGGLEKGKRTGQISKRLKGSKVNDTLYSTENYVENDYRSKKRLINSSLIEWQLHQDILECFCCKRLINSSLIEWQFHHDILECFCCYFIQITKIVDLLVKQNHLYINFLYCKVGKSQNNKAECINSDLMWEISWNMILNLETLTGYDMIKRL